jgi:hypothetical protein
MILTLQDTFGNANDQRMRATSSNMVFHLTSVIPLDLMHMLVGFWATLL